jgi:glucose uptake protein GlcU
MVKIYSIALALGFVGLLVVILGGAFADNLGREKDDPSRSLGVIGRSVIGGLVGFGMAGLSAEFSTFDLTWQAALVVAALGALVGALWAGYASREGSRTEDAGPL